MEEMKAEEIEEITKRVNQASPGPWKAYWEGRDHTSGSSFIMIGEGSTRLNDFEISGAKEADYDFIAHARQDIPRLLLEIQRLKNQLGKLPV
jgi:hypothetical protein